MKIETKSVSEMHVQCMFQVRNHRSPGIAASDCCQAHATAAVVYADGLMMWRCEEHKSLINSTTTSSFVRTIERRVE